MVMRHVPHKACENSDKAADDTHGASFARMRCIFAKTIDANFLKFSVNIIEYRLFPWESRDVARSRRFACIRVSKSAKPVRRLCIEGSR
jgi:hypothetical protein